MLKRLMMAPALAIALGVPVAAPQAQEREAPPAPGTPKNFTLPPKRSFTLPNGMQVTFVRYGEVPKATVDLAIRGAGIASEGPAEVWLASMTAEYLREGTATRTAVQIAEETARMGAGLGVSASAAQANLGGDVLREFVPEYISLLADVVVNPAFPESELQRIRAGRLRSLAIARTQPQQLALERFRQVVFGDHPFGRLLPTEQMLQQYTVEGFQQFHAANYGAARAHLYVVGQFDEAAAERAVRAAFSGWHAGSSPPPPTGTARTERAVHLINRPGAVQSTIYMGLPVIDPSHPDYQALRVTNTLLGGGFTSRITLNLREDKGFTYSPQSVLGIFPRAAYWVQVADVTTNVTGASLREIFYEIDRLRAEAPPADELRGVQNYLAGIFVLQNSTRQGIIAQLQFAELHGLGDDYLPTVVSRVMAVTPQDVRRIMQTHFDPARMAIVIAGDEAVIAEQVAPYRTHNP
jgi:zinc protease